MGVGFFLAPGMFVGVLAAIAFVLVTHLWWVLGAAIFFAACFIKGTIEFLTHKPPVQTEEEKLELLQQARKRVLGPYFKDVR